MYRTFNDKKEAFETISKKYEKVEGTATVRAAVMLMEEI